MIFTLLVVCTAFVLQAQPFRTPVFTGNAAADFKETEKNFSSGVAYCITWDASFVYLGVTGSAAYIKQEPTLFYFDTDPNVPAVFSSGNTVGFYYDNRGAALPFAGNVVVYFKEGYAEVRTSPSTSGTWGDATVYTANITTGTNDIEIKIPWSIFPNGVRPAAMSWLCFKTNGNAGQTDAYEIRPGTSNVASTYSFNINSLGPSLFYRSTTTADKFYPGVNLFSWIDNTQSTMCAPPATVSTTNITASSAKLNWASINGATQYLLRGRKKGTSLWQQVMLPGNRSSFTAQNLSCNTNYEWHIRTNCDTTQLVDINSGFSMLTTFKTSACAIQESPGLLLYPAVARAGAVIRLKNDKDLNGVKYSIINAQGVPVQDGVISDNRFQLPLTVNSGLYNVVVFGKAEILRGRLMVE